MADGNGCEVFSDAAWATWEPLIEAVRPRGKTPPTDLRRTISAILRRHQNGAKWRGIPAELGPWWLAARLFLRWAKQGVREPDAFRERIRDLGARPAIPPKRTDAPVACPDWIHVDRRLVENLWARLKEWRAVATRYEKTARSFLGVPCIAATADWLKVAKL